MLDMGRPKTVFLDLPPRMTARKSKSGSVRYYYNKGGKKLALGSDLNRARTEWAKHENGIQGEGATYSEAADRWEREELHKRAPKTQFDYLRALKTLYPAFKPFSLEQIQPLHVRQYLDRRSAKVAGNREIAVLSILFNWAREAGLTDKPNPCLGVRRNKEHSRERYVTQAEFDEVYARGDFALQDAMDLAYLTSQRPSDVLKMTRQDIRDGHLWVRQGKTGKRLGLRVEGRLKDVVERILARPRAVQTMFLISGDDGQRLTIWQLEGRFNKARGTADWQFRDLRAKSVSDEPDLSIASRRAGHANEKTTAEIYRRVKGDTLDPLK